MEWKDLLVDSCGRAVKAVESALDGLAREDLNWQPRPDSNSIGWTIWHLARVLDKLVSPIIEAEQFWTQEWHVEFNRSLDTEDTGWDDTPEQVAAFQCPDPETLLGYQRAVIQRMNGCLEGLSLADLDREVDDDSWSEFCPTVGSRLIIAVDELLQHAGQVCYIRGLRQGMGWQ